MIPAVILSLAAGLIGWRRAAKRGGNMADRAQFAAAHAIPTFLVALLAMTMAARMGWLA